MAEEEKQVRRVEGTLSVPAYIQVKQHKFDIGSDSVSGRDRTKHIYKDSSTVEHEFITKEETEDLISLATISISSSSSPFVIARTATEFKNYCESAIRYNIFCDGVVISDTSFAINFISSKVIYVNGENGLVLTSGQGYYDTLFNYPTSNADQDISIEFFGYWRGQAYSFNVNGGYSGNSYDYYFYVENTDCVVNSSQYVDFNYTETGNSLHIEDFLSIDETTENTRVGYRSLYNITTGQANTAHGSNSGLNLTTGNANTLIGRFAGSNLITGSSNIIIGSGIDASSTSATNELNIGGAIKGNLSTSEVELQANVRAPNIKIGTSQANAGASAGDLWADSTDGYSIKLGI